MENSSNKDESTIVKINDIYNDQYLKDSFNKKDNSNRVKPQGYVEIFEKNMSGNEKLLGKNNLVVYQGREWIAERIFNVENSSTSTDKDEFISWFGIGQGGADIVNDPLTAYNPASGDTDLASEVGLGIGVDAPGQYADFRSGDYFKHPFDSIVFEQDVNNNNEWLIVKITTTLNAEDANGNFINEAGLFTSTSLSAGHSGPFHIFSRVTFPTLVKNSDRQLVFVWYIYT